MTDEDICGAETADGTPCQHPAGSCPHPAHSDPDVDNPQGRPEGNTLRDDPDARERLYEATELGLNVTHRASMAGVSPDTLRRALCCVETPRKPDLTVAEPCDFCAGYARAHAEGAQEVLAECRPEFRASASFGYSETERREVEADHTHDATEAYAALVGAASEADGAGEDDTATDE